MTADSERSSEIEAWCLLTMFAEILQHVHDAGDEPLALPEYAVAIEEPCVVFVQEVAVLGDGV